MYVFWWNAPDTMTIAAEDELIHEGVDINHDRGSMITSKCERFACKAGMGLVEVDVLLRSAEGDTVHVTSKFAMMNNPS
jgi:hypothetical protein